MTATILPFAHAPHHAMMALHCTVPDTAMTAEMLGTKREGNAIQVTQDGLMITIGYSIMEADEIWLSNYKGQSAQATVVAHDYDSGIALLRPSGSLGRAYLTPASSETLTIGDHLSVLTSNDSHALPVELIAKEEFAGSWEYLLDNALYTSPLCEQWSGAALINDKQQLCGIGSLAVGLKTSKDELNPGNMFVPTDLVTPYLEYMSLHGQKPEPCRPWLGTLLDEVGSELHVIGLYPGAPADKAGVIPGDIILSIDNTPISNMVNFFRTLFRYGPAGSSISLTILRDETTLDVVVQSIDRNAFFTQHGSNIFN